MPLLTSSYRAPFYLFNGHLETVVPSLFRKITNVTYTRARLELPDGDFLDLDWLRQQSPQLVIISHGLEGSSERHYCKGMARYFFQQGWDTLAWNCRSCSGEMNRLPRFYHHGATEDLGAVVDHALAKGYHHVALVGISMGGSMTLKYLGERAANLSPAIRVAATFSVPCHLGASAAALDKSANRFYLKRFLQKLGKKIRAKEKMFPGTISATGFEDIRTFREFDNRYTAPLHGFRHADDFYERASCMPHLPKINVPTLLVNARNDPFLPEACYPVELVKGNPLVSLEIPLRGGHTGFTQHTLAATNYMEQSAFDFCMSAIKNG